MDNETLKVMRFFEPNAKMITWLKEYIGQRTPIDVGCGAGDLLLELHNGRGGLGIDPFFSGDRMLLMQKGIHILERRIEECEKFVQGLGARGIMIFARPCHSDFVERGIELAPPGMEVIYITKKSNIVKYCDLGEYEGKAVLLEHAGSGKAKEVVYSIKK
jgi:hypothetical protein